jgi:membrane fusion protein (multidrug efflux system)
VAGAATTFSLRAGAGGVQAAPGESATESDPADASGEVDPGAVQQASNDDAEDEEAEGEGEGEGEEGEEEEGETALPVNVAQVIRGTVSSYITATANLISENEVKVLAEAEGRVETLAVDEGSHINEGQELAGLVRDDAEIALRKAELKVTNAKLAYERGGKTIAADLLSAEDYEKLEMDYQIAEQELAEAEWRLSKTSIAAPFTGRVTERMVKLGQHVRPGDELVTVASFDPLVAYIFLPERDVFGLIEGRDVRITLKADGTTRVEGRIRQISPVVDTATGTVKVTIDAVSPPSEVRPGSFVTIEIVNETRQTAILVPRESVIRELQDAYVFVAKDDVAEKRTVALGIEEGESVELLSGVEPGEDVITAGQGGLKDGAKIKIIPAIEASDLMLRPKRSKRG